MLDCRGSRIYTDGSQAATGYTFGSFADKCFIISPSFTVQDVEFFMLAEIYYKKNVSNSLFLFFFITFFYFVILPFFLLSWFCYFALVFGEFERRRR